MATVDKNFRIKNGLVVEGSVATVNGNSILTEVASDQYILNLIGGETLVKSVDSIFNVDSSGNLTLNYSRDNIPGTIMFRDGFGNLAAGQIDLDSKVTAPDYRVGNAGKLYDNDGTLELAGYNSNDVRIYAPNNINIDANNGDIVLRPDGNAKIWNDNIATQGYADNTASNAQLAAQSYADTVSGNAYTNAVSDAQTFANNAYDNATNYADGILTQANGYTDSAVGTEVGNRNQAITDAISTEVTNRNNAIDSAISTEVTNRDNAISTALASANTYTDNAVTDLVNSAPAMLDTLGELATALQNNPDIITNLQDVAAGKQDTLEAGNGIVIDGNLIYVPTSIGSGISVTPNTVEIDRTVVDTWYDAAGAASSAQSAAETFATNAANAAEFAANSYADSLAPNYDAAGAASSAQSAAETYTDNAVNSLTSGNTQFTTVSIGWMSREVAAYSYENGTSVVTAYAWDKWQGSSAKFLVRVRNGVHSQVSEILLTKDNSDNIAITEYGIVTTNGILADITADYNSGTSQIQLKVTPAHTGGTEIIVAGTLMSYGD